MNRLYIISPKLTAFDNSGRQIKDIGIYDDSLLYDYLIDTTLRGSNIKEVAKAKRAIYHFLEYWQDGERRITVSFGDFSISTFPVSYIEPEEGLINLGERPADPGRDVVVAMSRLTSAINYSSPNAAALYQHLQDTLKKYPTLPLKEQA